jgi:hypothetical protein
LRLLQSLRQSMWTMISVPWQILSRLFQAGHGLAGN